MYVLLILVCPFILFLFAIVLSVLRFTDSDYLPLVSSNSSYTWRKFKSEILYNVWNVVTLYKQGLWLWRLIYTFVYHIWNSRLWLDDLLSTLLTQLYVKVDILLYHSGADTVICEGWHFTHMHVENICMTALFHYEKGGWVHEFISTPPLFSQVPVKRQECEPGYRFCLCFYHFSIIFFNCCGCVLYMFFILYMVYFAIFLYFFFRKIKLCSNSHFSISWIFHNKFNKSTLQKHC